jgi:hypothetical protein
MAFGVNGVPNIVNGNTYIGAFARTKKAIQNDQVKQSDSYNMSKSGCTCNIALIT